MSGMYELVKSLSVDDEGDGYVVKNSTARDLIMALPSPTNLIRRRALIPQADVELYLSTTEKLPPMIRNKINDSEDRELFDEDDTLMGLCMSGRGLPVKIFLHEPAMLEMDPTGNLFDEVGWHELVHGIEGIKKKRDGTIIRKKPWSYALQEVMLENDRRKGTTPVLSHEYSPKLRQFFKYLREGTDLQQNVSEPFARVAAVFMIQVREKGIAPLPTDLPKKANALKEFDPLDREASNLTDLFCALSLYSNEAQDAFWHLHPEAIRRVSKLYGCVAPT